MYKKYWHSGIDYRVASLSIGYLTSKGIVPAINIQINEKSYSLRTDPNYRKISPLKTNKITKQVLNSIFYFIYFKYISQHLIKINPSFIQF